MPTAEDEVLPREVPAHLVASPPATNAKERATAVGAALCGRLQRGFLPVRGAIPEMDRASLQVLPLSTSTMSGYRARVRDHSPRGTSRAPPGNEYNRVSRRFHSTHPRAAL